MSAPLAVHDRRHWEISLEMEAARFRRYGSTYAIIVVTLDELSSLEQSQGSTAAEELVAVTGVMLSACVRPSDCVARVGKDEFGILAVECDREGASALTTRVTESFATVGVRASLGVAVARPGRDGMATWQAATAAMLDSRATLGVLAERPDHFEAPI